MENSIAYQLIYYLQKVLRQNIPGHCKVRPENSQSCFKHHNIIVYFLKPTIESVHVQNTGVEVHGSKVYHPDRILILILDELEDNLILDSAAQSLLTETVIDLVCNNNDIIQCTGNKSLRYVYMYLHCLLSEFHCVYETWHHMSYMHCLHTLNDLTNFYKQHLIPKPNKLVHNISLFTLRLANRLFQNN